MSRAVNSMKPDVKPDKRSKVGYWLRWIASAKKAAKQNHWPDSQAAWAEYEFTSSKDESVTDNKKKGYQIYWASCAILYPSFYARTPKVKCKRINGIEDEMALTMSLISDRLGQFLVDHGNFDDAMLDAVGDFIHASKATTQVIYTTETETQRVPLQQSAGEDGEPVFYKDSVDKPYDGDFEQDDTGAYGSEEVAREETQQITLAPVCFDEVLHTPNAKTQSEIMDMAYKFSLEKDEAEEKFNTGPDGKSKGLALPYKTSDQYRDDDDTAEALDLPGLCLEGWEIYCAATKKVYWVSEDYKDDVLLIEDDPYGLYKFFPSPAFKLVNKHRKSLYPTPTWVYLEATANQLHTLYYRMFRLIDAVRRRAIVFNASPELIAALNKLEGEEFISAGDTMNILDKGGLKDLIQYVDVQELVAALSEAMNVEEHFKNTFFEWFGVPEVMRGNSDPGKTAEAVSIENESAVNRFRYNKKQIVDLARDSAEMMLDLALKVFSDQKIAQLCGYDYLEAGDPGSPAVPPSQENPKGLPAVPPKPGHKERFLEALTRLRSDRERVIRVDFETDATSFRDEERDLNRQKLISDTVLQGLAQLSNIQHPANYRIALQMLLSVVNAMGGSTQSEDLIRQAMSDLQKEKDAPQAPPPPDYESMKIQVATSKVQADQQKTQLENEVKMREISVKEMEAQMKAQADQAANQLEMMNFQLEQAKAAATQALAQQKEGFTEQLDMLLANIEQQKVEITKFQAQMDAQLTILQEARLEKEAMLELVKEHVKLNMAEAPPVAPAQPSPPPAPDIHIHMPSGDKVYSHKRDAQGNLTETTVKGG